MKMRTRDSSDSCALYAYKVLKRSVIIKKKQISGNLSGHTGFAWKYRHKEVWRVLDLEYENPYMNRALEEAVARKVGERLVPNTIRFWRNPNSVVIGRFQSVALEVNLEACRKYKTRIVRRFTEGGAVYHDRGNLNYTICFHKEHRLFKKDVLETFTTLAQAVIEGLKILGVPAEFKSPNSIQIGDLKFSGLAGSTKWGSVLYHGSLLVSSNLEILSKVLDVDEKKVKHKYVSSVKKKETTLYGQLRREIPLSEVKQALKQGFKRSFLMKLVCGELTKDEIGPAKKLYKEKYSTKKWNFKYLQSFVSLLKSMSMVQK